MSEIKSDQEVNQRRLTYPKMTAFKSFKNRLSQKIIHIIGRFLRRNKASSERSIYQNPLYLAVKEREVEADQLKVMGDIPQHLNGLLLRIGSNPIYDAQPTLFEWYLGDGMVHGLKLQHGQPIWFKSKMLATDTVQNYKKQPKIQGFRRGAHDVVNTNIFRHANQLWAVIEAGAFPICLDDELNAQRYQLFNSDADLPFTAHPRKDMQTGHLHAICYDALDAKNANYQVIDEHGKLIHFTQIALNHGPMIHDCLITEHEVIIFDFPLTFSFEYLRQGKSVPYQWNRQHQARIGLLVKYGNAEQIQWIDVAPCFIFHAANAYRDGTGQVILDVLVHYPDFDHAQHAAYEQQNAKLERWIVNVQTQQIKRSRLDERVQEFPKIDERYTGRAYRYLYCIGFQTADRFNFLIIHDLLMHQSQTYDFGELWAVGEVTFVAGHEESAEGEGYLMLYLHHIHGEASKVVILNVNGLSIQPQAEIDLGAHVPLGFHCNWVDLSGT